MPEAKKAAKKANNYKNQSLAFIEKPARSVPMKSHRTPRN